MKKRAPRKALRERRPEKHARVPEKRVLEKGVPRKAPRDRAARKALRETRPENRAPRNARPRKGRRERHPGKGGGAARHRRAGSAVPGGTATAGEGPRPQIIEIIEIIEIIQLH